MTVCVMCVERQLLMMLNVWMLNAAQQGGEHMQGL